MNTNKINELLEKYERLRKNTVNIEGEEHHPLKRTYEQTSELDTLQHLKNKELKRANTSKPTSKNILSSYEHDEKVTGVDRQMEIFKNMASFDNNKYKDAKEWYIEKELNRLSKQLKK